MTEIEMINEAKTQWSEVKEIVENELDFCNIDVIENHLRAHPDISNVWKVNDSDEETTRFDFDYKKITATICVEKGCLPDLSTHVDYWENEDGAVHSFEIAY